MVTDLQLVGDLLGGKSSRQHCQYLSLSEGDRGQCPIDAVDMIGRLWRYAGRRPVMAIDHIVAHLDLHQKRSTPLDERTGLLRIGHNKSDAEAKIHCGSIIQNDARTAHRNFLVRRGGGASTDTPEDQWSGD